MADDILPLLGFRDDRSTDSDAGNEAEGALQPDSTNTDSDISYDASLPAQHTISADLEIILERHDEFNVLDLLSALEIMNIRGHIRTDLEELRGRTMLEDDATISLPLLSLPGVVLIPGQTLPLHFFQPATVSMVKNIIENDRTFGLVNARYTGPEFIPMLAPVGTTAEIRSYKEVIDERTGHCTIRVKTEGRQRFQLLDRCQQSDGILIGRVKILPEILSGDFLEGARPASTLRSSSSKFSRLQAARFTWWPMWVYMQYDEQTLMTKIQQELLGWNASLKVDSMPKHAVEFSYWVAANLPLDDTLRLNILGIDSVIQRLRCELSVLRKCTVLCCKECTAEVTDKKDVFSMSIEGPQGMYVNPVGYVHETLTVYRTRSLLQQGESSTEYSWFPGYAWTVVQCRSCGTHVGWKFTSTDRKLKPEKFWGLCRSSLQPGIKNEDSDGNCWVPCL